MAAELAKPLKPGDPPPFWEGLWHPQGKAEGAAMVKPRMYGGAAATVSRSTEAPAAQPSPPAAASVVASPPPPPIAAPPVAPKPAPPPVAAPPQPVAPPPAPVAPPQPPTAPPGLPPRPPSAADMLAAMTESAPPPRPPSAADMLAALTDADKPKSEAGAESSPSSDLPPPMPEHLQMMPERISLPPEPEPEPAPVPVAAAPDVAPPPLAAPPAAAQASAPPAPPAPEPAHPAAPTQPRSLIVTLLTQGPITAITAIPPPIEGDRAEALRTKAKEFQAQNQLGQALATLTEAIKIAPGDAASYAHMGQVLMAGRALEDAAHHFLLAYMLAPKESTYARMTLHAAWTLGYVGWAFQIAQSLHKLAPSQDLIDTGRAAAAWLQGGRPAGFTSLCTACRTNAMARAPGPCPKCGGTAMNAPANDIGFAGLRLLQQTPPGGRLFVGATCRACSQETTVLVAKGGAKCLKCGETALAPM